jgi:hypothetical protein
MAYFVQKRPDAYGRRFPAYATVVADIDLEFGIRGVQLMNADSTPSTHTHRHTHTTDDSAGHASQK